MMLYLCSLGGVALYIGYVWLGWSNKYDTGGTKLTFKERLWFERQELSATIVGAILFMVGGDGLVHSICEFIGTVLGEKYGVLCASIYGNISNLVWILGGAYFGSVLLLLVSYSKNRAKKKLSE